MISISDILYLWTCSHYAEHFYVKKLGIVCFVAKFFTKGCFVPQQLNERDKGCIAHNEQKRNKHKRK